MKRIIGILSELLILFITNVYSTVFYMAPPATPPTGWSAGSDTKTGLSKTAPKASLAGACNVMKSGDTLIIADGTYSGSNNTIERDPHFPFGSTSKYTVIKAEHDGGVVFDGARIAYQPTSSTATYWQFEGLIWANCEFSVEATSYVKVIRCGGYNGGNGNVTNFYAGVGCDYILFENCFGWGSGRFKFCGYQSNRIIMRQCVARMDREDAVGEPVAGFAMYSVTNGLCQNCICLDSDSSSVWSNAYSYNGGFYIPVTNMAANNITIERSIVLNSKMGGIQSDGQSYRSSNVIVKDCIIWNVSVFNQSDWANKSEGDNPKWINNTFGVSDKSEAYLSGYNSSGMIINNNIFCNITGGGLIDHWPSAGSGYDYNSYYKCTGMPSALGSHDISNVNPIWNSSSNPSGALKYLVKVETGSTLSGKGKSGADIGANCLKMVGAPGTLWGDPGYDAEQSASMWPFPNEDLIKAKMAHTATGITGQRGFCSGNSLDGSPQTLTKYIWEYLGNQIPPEIYTTGVIKDFEYKNIQRPLLFSLVGYPNPFNKQITIKLAKNLNLGKNESAVFNIYDIQGKIVYSKNIRIEDEILNWNANSMSSGTYIAKLNVKGMVYSNKMILLK